jgi:hypothetical protein
MFGKQSTWQFVTTNTASASYGFGAVEGGTIEFSSPDGSSMTLYYASGGAGASEGVKMPNFVTSGSMLPSGGRLYLSETFDGDELQRSDLTGPCYFLEIGGGVGGGASFVVMTLGVTWAKLGFKLIDVAYGGVTIWGQIIELSGVLDSELDMRSNAVLVAGGMTAGFQGGGGIIGYAGMVW